MQPTAGPATVAAKEPVREAPEVIAYYFHGTIRCETCLKIEKQAQELIRGRFAGEVALNRLAFKPVNYDQPENVHFLKDYKLPCPSLTLVRHRGGKDWKILGKAWELVQAPPKLDEYIEEEIVRFLAGSSSDLPGSPGATKSGATTNSATSVLRQLGGLSELDSLASEMNAVLVFLPAKDSGPTTSALTAINSAKETLEARLNIKIGLFTLAPDSQDYEDIASHMSVPGVVAIVKTGTRQSVSGELTEDKIIEGFMAAVASGGCCPLGHPGEPK